MDASETKFTWLSLLYSLINNPGLLLLLACILFAFLGISGGINTQWFNCDFPSIYQKVVFIIFSLLFFVSAIFMHRWKKSLSNGKDLRSLLLEGDGQFEWQWAGQNWMGHVTFKEDAQKQIKFKIDVSKIYYLRKQGVTGSITSSPDIPKIISTVSEGCTILHEYYVELKDIAIKRNIFKSIKIGNNEIEGMEVNYTSNEILNVSSLKPITAFAGKIRYKNSDTAEIIDGDIIIVKYQSTVYMTPT